MPVHAEGVLGLVHDALRAGAVHVAVVRAADLVGELLACGLGVVGLGAAVCECVSECSFFLVEKGKKEKVK